MKVVRSFALVLLSAVPALAQLPISGARVQNAQYTNLTGTATFTVTDANDTDVTYTPAGGSPTTAPIVANIVNGVVQTSGGFPPKLPDPATTAPDGIRFRAVIKNAAGFIQFTFPLINVTTGAFSLDQYTVPAGVTASGLGYPKIRCDPHGMYEDTTASNPYPWVCSRLPDGTVAWTQNPSLNPACQQGNTQATVSPATGSIYCIPSTQAFATPGYVYGGPGAGNPDSIGLTKISTLCANNACAPNAVLDPGDDGLLFRAGANVTRPAHIGDITGMFSGSSGALCKDGTAGTCGISGGGGTAGLTDPATNGVIFRSALNTTRVATVGDLTGIFPTGSGAICRDGTVGTCGISTGGTGGIVDPGNNGVLFRSALNATRVATAPDVAGLFTGSGTFLRSDGTKGNAAIVPNLTAPLAGNGSGGVVAATSTSIAGLFSGTGTYLRADGTTGTPPGSALPNTLAPLRGNNTGGAVAATAADIAGLFGTGGVYLKTDGTSGSPAGTVTTAGAQFELQGANGAANGFVPTGVYSANNQINLKLPTLANCRNSSLTNPNGGQIDTCHTISSIDTNPGYSYGPTGVNAMNGWYISKALNIYKRSYAKGIKSAFEIDFLSNGIGDTNNYLRTYSHGGYRTGADEGTNGLKVTAGIWQHVYAGTQTARTGDTITINPTQDGQNPFSGGALIRLNAPVFSGHFVGSTNTTFTTSEAATPSTAIGTTAGPISITANGEVGNSATVTLNVTTGSFAQSGVVYFACGDSFVDTVYPTSVSTKNGSNQQTFTGVFRFSHPSTCAVYQGGTHGYVDITADRRQPQDHLMRTAYLVIGTDPNAHTLQYRLPVAGNYAGVPGSAHDFGHSATFFIMGRTNNVVTACLTDLNNPNYAALYYYAGRTISVTTGTTGYSGTFGPTSVSSAAGGSGNCISWAQTGANASFNFTDIAATISTGGLVGNLGAFTIFPGAEVNGINFSTGESAGVQNTVYNNTLHVVPNDAGFANGDNLEEPPDPSSLVETFGVGGQFDIPSNGAQQVNIRSVVSGVGVDSNHNTIWATNANPASMYAPYGGTIVGAAAVRIEGPYLSPLILPAPIMNGTAITIGFTPDGCSDPNTANYFFWQLLGPTQTASERYNCVTHALDRFIGGYHYFEDSSGWRTSAPITAASINTQSLVVNGVQITGNGTGTGTAAPGHGRCQANITATATPTTFPLICYNDPELNETWTLQGAHFIGNVSGASTVTFADGAGNNLITATSLTASTAGAAGTINSAHNTIAPGGRIVINVTTDGTQTLVVPTISYTR